jgi:hypothetical protein
VGNGTPTTTPTPTPTTSSNKFNDTGIVMCANGSTRLGCPQALYPVQDADYGRDSTHNNAADGHAGFSFTKLDVNGIPLANQSVAYDSTAWACVKDNTTGLIWEVKTKDKGLHDFEQSYTWYIPDSTHLGGFDGRVDDGNNGCGGTLSECNTHSFINAVNSAGWCGAKNWRLPTLDELSSLINFNKRGPAIDSDFFPNTASRFHWTLSKAAIAPPNADGIPSVWGIGFMDGYSGATSKYAGGDNGQKAVRLVHDPL